MAGLDNIPQTQTVELATVKLDETTFETIKELNEKINSSVLEVVSLYIRKKDMEDELLKIDDALESNQSEIRAINLKLNEIAVDLDDKYPQARINIGDGTIQYQPGAPTRKQQAEQQTQQQSSSMKVVKQ